MHLDERYLLEHHNITRIKTKHEYIGRFKESCDQCSPKLLMSLDKTINNYVLAIRFNVSKNQEMRLQNQRLVVILSW